MNTNNPKLAEANSPLPAVTRAAARAKYRPSMSAEQIQQILYLAKTHSDGLSVASINLIATLAPFAAKIENSGIVAAYIVQPARPSTTSLEALGAAPAGSTGSSAGNTAANVANKEEYWEACYNQWLLDPVVLSLDQLEAAQEWRYLNDMMSPEEEQAHEQK